MPAISSGELKEVCDERGLRLHVATIDVVKPAPSGSSPLLRSWQAFVGRLADFRSRAQASPVALFVDDLARQCC
jgi:hypothetical protein